MCGVRRCVCVCGCANAEAMSQCPPMREGLCFEFCRHPHAEELAELRPQLSGTAGPAHRHARETTLPLTLALVPTLPLPLALAITSTHALIPTLHSSTHPHTPLMHSSPPSTSPSSPFRVLRDVHRHQPIADFLRELGHALEMTVMDGRIPWGEYT